ncbi:MAG: hypothetical protein HFI70_07585 [Lachnospiraceae bacterium]|nr:hypothetical protein [Lachnospiraceae bacterium]
MTGTRKQITFDLDAKALQKHYPGESWNNVYDIIKRHMLKNGFKWLQGSVYVSEYVLTTGKVTRILRGLVKKNPWLNLCVRDCRETNIGKDHSKNHIFDKGANILAREDTDFGGI